MTKFAFPNKKVVDEWNPHLVRYVRESAPLFTSHHANEQEMALFSGHIQTWLSQWNSAQRVLNEVQSAGVYPLVYRLDPQLSVPLEIDPISGSKFGGVPDFRYEIKNWASSEGELQERISTLWPKCDECGEHMRFLAGADLSDWLLAIHVMTANEPTHTNYGRKITEADIHYYQHSGVGFGKNVCADIWPFISPFYQIFYCADHHDKDVPFSDARIQIERRYGKRYEERALGDKKLLDIEPYREVISQFLADHKIESDLPIQTIDRLSLKFDIDIPGKRNIDWMGKVREAHPEIFGEERGVNGKTSPYQFFGHPYSQQDERRYACQSTFLGLHRMAPIVNWTDQNEDYSRQIYGCLRCHGDQEVYCKVDGSCT
ncbi:MAG: hypothetical protein WCV90_05230 [Candidatus Woesearchaeota archaeon]|jgi:hypothetical protein